MNRTDTLATLGQEIRQCRLCEAHLPLGPGPVLQISDRARLLIAGQAPGSKAHESRVPFDDASGERLRDWLGLKNSEFYDESLVAILPMAFCYPGRGKSGDLPPRRECADTWRDRVLDKMTQLELTVVIGQYARVWHFRGSSLLDLSLTEHVRAQDAAQASTVLMPHPSPRNNIWLKRNPWFEQETVPLIRDRIGLLCQN